MLSVTLLCVGRLKERHFIDACREYEKRLSGMIKLDVVELPEEADGPGALEREAGAVLNAIPKGALVAALCVEGTTLSSEELSARLADAQSRGVSRVCVLIGSSRGLADSVKRRADLRLSMSRLTFPHHLARVMALEQLYRALSISRGGKYHK